MIALLTARQVEQIRASVPAGAAVGWRGFSRLPEADYDYVSLIESAGRAKCRACGSRIAKGEIVVRAVVEFPTASCAGSHAARPCYLHARACP